MDNLYQIPEGLDPEAKQQFCLLAEENISLTNQIQQARGVLVGAPESDSNQTKIETKNEQSIPSSLLTKANIGKKEKVLKPVHAIREFCFQCQGWHGEGTRKPKKRVRECEDKECPLHPFRMGKNPNMIRV